MRDTFRHDVFGVLLVYPDSKKAALGSPGFREVYRTLSGVRGAVVDWGWYDEGIDRIEYKCRTWRRRYRCIAVSVPFELLYGNVIRALAALGVEPEKGNREPGGPVVMIGGAAPTINPSVAQVLADIVYIGEIEAHSSDIENRLSSVEQSGAASRLTPMIGITIPMQVNAVPDFISPVDSIGSSMIHGFDEPALCTFENAGVVEVGRGCSRGCRFCAAGHIYLPARHRDVDAVLRDARTFLGAADRIGLVGAALSDHGSLKDILRGILDMGFGLTTSSFRADMIDDELVGLLTDGGLRTLTIAPEGGSERIRRIINKRLPEARILEAAEAVSRSGIRNLRLYYMVGLPWERQADIDDVVALTAKIRSIFRGPGRTIVVSVNPFIPKPQTPFQWCGMAKTDYLEKTYWVLKRAFQAMPGVGFKVMSIRAAVREAVISLGNEDVGYALIDSVRDGIPWKKALVRRGVNVDRLVHREKTPDERFPWDDISGETKKAALLATFEKAKWTAQEE